MASLMSLFFNSGRVARVKALMPLFGLFVLSLFGGVIDFLAATWWRWTGLVLTLLWAFRYRDWLRGMCFGEDHGLFESVVSFALGAALMWMIIVRTAGGAVTLSLGHYAVIRPVIMHIHHASGRSRGHACREQWRGDQLDQFGQMYICVKDAYEVAHPGVAPTYDGREVEGELVGARGPFGFYILRLNILRDIEPEGSP